MGCWRVPVRSGQMTDGTTILESRDDTSAESLGVGTWWRRYVDPLILFMLGSFAITQPLLSDFRAGAGYFVARRNEPIEIVLLVVILTLAPGLIANAVVWVAAAFSTRARAIAQSVFVGIFVAFIAHTALVRLTSISWVMLGVVSVVIGGVSAVAFGRSKWLRTFFTFLIPAPLIFALFFLVTPPVSGLVFPATPATVEATVVSEAPVVFVVFDEFPVVSLLNAGGAIDGSRYPNFAKLASMSTWYKYTSSAHVFTSWALPSLLAAQSPDSSLLPTTANYPDNLFTLLDGSYSMHVVEPSTRLCPPESCGHIRPTSFADRLGSLIADTFTLYATMLRPDSTSSVSVSDPFGEFNAGTLDTTREGPFDHVGQFGDFLDGITSSPSTLHFEHVLLPHAPFSYYPSGRQYHGGGELDGHESEVWVEPVLADQARQRHLLQVQRVDGLIGDLLARLESLGILDDAIVVVTADHGISFRPDTPRRDITDGNAYEVGLVPLFIKAPHQDRGVADTTPARAIDVMPTVAELLGLELPWAHEGQSLIGNSEGLPTLVVQAGGGEEILLGDVEQGVRDITADMEALFGDEHGGFDLYELGGYDSVVGLSTAELATRPSEVTAEVDEIWRLSHVAPYTGFVPGFLHGHLAGEVGENLQLLVALNGVVRTVVPVFDSDHEEARFNAILPDDAFVAGFNDLELFAVSGASDAPVIETVAVEDNTRFQMENAEDGRVARLLDSEGGSWPVVQRSTVTGYVDAAGWPEAEYETFGPKDLYLHGWAVDRGSLQPVDRVVYFANEVFAGSTTIDVERPANAEFYETDDVLVSGFVGKLAHFLPSENLNVRAFALFDGNAHELPITDVALSDIYAG